MARKTPTINVGGLSEFVPPVAGKAEPRVVVTVTTEDHNKMISMAKEMSKSAGRFVSLGLVVTSLIKHYESFE